MAKKNVSQLGTLVGKVYYAGVSDVKESKGGKEYVDYSFGLKLSNGASVFATDRLWNPNNEDMSDFQRATIEEYDWIVENYKEEDVYVSKSVRPTKLKKTKEEVMAFDVLSSYVNKEGAVKHLLKGRVNLLNGTAILNDAGDVVDFELEFYKLSVDGNSKSFGHWWHRR